jgi:hypothetical protein
MRYIFIEAENCFEQKLWEKFEKFILFPLHFPAASLTDFEIIKLRWANEPEMLCYMFTSWLELICSWLWGSLSGGYTEVCLLGYNAVSSVETSYLSLLAIWTKLVSCLAYSSTLKMEATCSSETSVDFQRTTRRYIPEVRTLFTLFQADVSSWNSEASDRKMRNE